MGHSGAVYLESLLRAKKVFHQRTALTAPRTARRMVMPRLSDWGRRYSSTQERIAVRVQATAGSRAFALVFLFLADS